METFEGAKWVSWVQRIQKYYFPVEVPAESAMIAIIYHGRFGRKFGRDRPENNIFGFFGPRRPILHLQMLSYLILRRFWCLLNFGENWRNEKLRKNRSKFLRAHLHKFWLTSTNFKNLSEIFSWGVARVLRRLLTLNLSLWGSFQTTYCDFGDLSEKTLFLNISCRTPWCSKKFLARGTRANKKFFWKSENTHHELSNALKIISIGLKPVIWARMRQKVHSRAKKKFRPF